VELDRGQDDLEAVAAILLLAVAVFAIGQVADFHKMTHALDEADGRWFLVCLAGELLAYAGYIAAYRDFARVDRGPLFSLWTVTRVVAVGFGAFVAGSSAGTLGVDYWALHRAGDNPHTAARRVLALNTLEWGVLALCAWAAGIVVLVADRGAAPTAMAIAWVAVLPPCVALALWFTAKTRVERLTTIPKNGKGFARAFRVALADALGGVVLVRTVLRHPRRYPLAVLGFPVFWAGDILALWAAIRAFDADVGLAALILAYTTAYVVTSLPLPAGGAGGVEAGLAFSLDAVGVPLAAALLATLVYRFFTLWLPIAIAAFAVTQVKALADELPLVEHG